MTDTICINCQHYDPIPGNSPRRQLEALCKAEGAKVGSGLAAQAYFVLGQTADIRCVTVNTEGACPHYQANE